MNESCHSSPGEFTDEQLACRAQAGSKSCFAELVRRYSGRLLRFVGRKIPHCQDAEDLVQDTFVKAYQHLGRYRKRYTFRTWLYTIASRLIIDHHRLSRKTTSLDNQMIASGTAEPSAILAQEEKVNSIWSQAKQLPPKQVDVLWLKYAEGMKIKEIARVLRMTEINVRVLLHRARRRLLQQEQPDPSVSFESRACLQERI